MSTIIHLTQADLEAAAVAWARGRLKDRAQVGKATIHCDKGDPGHYADRGAAYGASVTFTPKEKP